MAGKYENCNLSDSETSFFCFIFFIKVMMILHNMKFTPFLGLRKCAKILIMVLPFHFPFWDTPDMKTNISGEMTPLDIFISIFV